MRYSDRAAEAARKNFRDVDEGSTLGVGQYLEIARRRAALILLTAMTVTVIVMIVVRHMPNKYRAETVILVDPQEVPGTLVPSIITSSVSDRLSTIQQEVTSPTRL